MMPPIRSHRYRYWRRRAQPCRIHPRISLKLLTKELVGVPARAGPRWSERSKGAIQAPRRDIELALIHAGKAEARRLDRLTRGNESASRQNLHTLLARDADQAIDIDELVEPHPDGQ